MFSLNRLENKDIFIDIPKSDFNGIVFYIIRNSRFSDKKKLFNRILEREKIGTTAIGDNTAIPHCRMEDFEGIYVKFALFRKDAGYVAPNGDEIRFLFLIVGPNNNPGYYLRTLSHIAKIMKNPDVRKELLQAKNKKEVRRIFRIYENAEWEKIYSWK